MYVYLPGVLRSREGIYFHLFQIGLLIIDTQGTYGKGHSTAETVSIFTLSNIVSSFQVYNVKESVNEKDWESLQVKTNVIRKIRNVEGGKGDRQLCYGPILKHGQNAENALREGVNKVQKSLYAFYEWPRIEISAY